MVTAQLQLIRTIISLHTCLDKRSINSLGSSDVSGPAMYLKEVSCLVHFIKRQTVGFPEMKLSLHLDGVEIDDRLWDNKTSILSPLHGNRIVGSYCG